MTRVCLIVTICWGILAFQSEVAGFTGARLVAFRVAEMVFAVEAAVVKEIIPMHRATRLPGAHCAVVGLINVRGRILSLVDARRALNYPPADDDGPIMLLEIGGHTAGLVVDDVLDLFSVSHDEFDGQGSLPGIDSALVRSVGRQAGVSFILLDIEALLGPILNA